MQIPLQPTMTKPLWIWSFLIKILKKKKKIRISPLGLHINSLFGVSELSSEWVFTIDYLWNYNYYMSNPFDFFYPSKSCWMWILNPPCPMAVIGHGHQSWLGVVLCIIFQSPYTSLNRTIMSVKLGLVCPFYWKKKKKIKKNGRSLFKENQPRG